MKMTVTTNANTPSATVTEAELDMAVAFGKAAEIMRAAMSTPTLNMTVIVNNGDTVLHLER